MKWSTLILIIFAFTLTACQDEDALSEAIKGEQRVVINEVTSSKLEQGKLNDAIEIYNGKLFSINLKGWKLKDAQGKTYKIKKNKRVPARGYLVLVKKKHKLSLKKVGNVTLINSEGLVVDQVSWEKNMAKRESYCRLPNAMGVFKQCGKASFGAENHGRVIEKMELITDASGQSYNLHLYSSFGPGGYRNWQIETHDGQWFELPSDQLDTISSSLLYNSDKMLGQIDLTAYLKNNKKLSLALYDPNGNRIDFVKWKRKKGVTEFCRSKTDGNKLIKCGE